MKPLYLVVTSFFPEPGNWRCAFAFDYVKAIMRDGRYEVVVFKPGSSYEYEGVKVNGFRSIDLPSGIPCPLLTPINVRLFVSAVKTAGYREEDIAVAEAYTNGRVPHLLALKNRNPNILVLAHHHDPASFGVFDGRFRHFWPFKVMSYYMRRIPYEKVDLHVFVSEIVKDSFLMFPKTDWSAYGEYARLGKGIQFLRRVKIKDAYVLHNGVDLKVFSRRTSPAQGVGRTSTFTIGCIGNFVDWKNQIQLIKAVQRLKGHVDGVKCIFVGSGPEIGRCRDYVRTHGLSDVVEFRREVKHEALADFYRGIDLFCLPSYFEGFGCVFTEAYACGVPFMTCEGQGMDDLVSDEERELWLCKAGDGAGLAEKILHYAEARRAQTLKSAIDMDSLVREFLDYLGKKKEVR